ncbi:MAG: hypothetical protein WC869_00715 [Phycisphaerae bacterium]
MRLLRSATKPKNRHVLAEDILKKEIEQKFAFKKAAKPLIAYLNKYHHPHTKVIVDPTSAEILEGAGSVVTAEFVRD